MANGPKWVKAWINQMAVLNDRFRDDDGKIDFAALGREEYAYRMALIQGRLAKSQRAREAYDEARRKYAANVANGSKGGRPRKRPQDFEAMPGGAPSGDAGDADVRTTAHGQGPDHPADTAELYAFAAENGLDEIDAREWYEMTAKRGWRDRYGNPIRDWKLACEAYCARKALNRLKKEDK